MRADALTQLVARRVNAIRKSQNNLSGAALSARVRKLGVSSWADSTISKLETGRRESISVTELFALAIALDVPPLWLVVDPADSGDLTPLTSATSEDWTTTALWALGQRSLNEHTGRDWAVAATSFRLALSLDQLVRELRASALKLEIDLKYADEDEQAQQRQDADRRDRRTFVIVDRQMSHLHEAGSTVPPMPADILGRAAELGVSLGAVDGP